MDTRVTPSEGYSDSDSLSESVGTGDLESNQSGRGRSTSIRSRLHENDRWLFAGWGGYQDIKDLNIGSAVSEIVESSRYSGDESDGGGWEALKSLPGKVFGSKKPEITEEKYLIGGHTHKLGQWMATSISANDITSSCLYVAGVAAHAAGIWAPISLALVAGVLYLFRSIYGEVVTAIPLNGGSYNALLNTTSKNMAALAACLTLLSYVSTAVVSATSASQYFYSLWDGIPVAVLVVVLLGFFALLNLIGISESAGVALAIFAVHMVTLSVLVVTCSYYMIFGDGFRMLTDNWNAAPKDASVAKDIFFGFAAAFLGISGFESSANFVEEQKEGVFVKTLRNMWYIVTLFNPVITFLAFGVLPTFKVTGPDSGALLGSMGEVAGGVWLKYMVGVDATLVLSGAVLTSYVGVGGLMRRMALDRCLPNIFIQENPCRHTAHWIILGFFLTCTSLYFIVDGAIETLSGVYTVAFLSVMALFAIGNILLKYKRNKLKRQVRSTWPGVVIALIAIIVGLIGNIVLNPSILEFFAIYFTVTVVIVWTMFLRISIFKVFYFFVNKGAKTKGCCGQPFRWILSMIQSQVQSINAQRFVFFDFAGRVDTLNKALLYMRVNEQTSSIYFVFPYEHERDIPPGLAEGVKVLDQAYPKIKLDLVLAKGHFGPEMVMKLSERLDVPYNLMFLPCPPDHFPFELGDLGGVRIITH